MFEKNIDDYRPLSDKYQPDLPLPKSNLDGGIGSNHHPEWEHPLAKELADNLEPVLGESPNYFAQREMIGFKAESLNIEID